eukprot:5975_1
MMFTVVQGFIISFGICLILNLLLVLILFIMDCFNRPHYKLVIICCILSGIGHCMLLYFLTLALDNNTQTFSHLSAWNYCGIFLTEFLSRICLYITFVCQAYVIFNHTRFAFSGRFIFLFILLIITLLILLSVIIFDYQVSATFEQLDS